MNLYWSTKNLNRQLISSSSRLHLIHVFWLYVDNLDIRQFSEMINILSPRQGIVHASGKMTMRFDEVTSIFTILKFVWSFTSVFILNFCQLAEGFVFGFKVQSPAIDLIIAFVGRRMIRLLLSIPQEQNFTFAKSTAGTVNWDSKAFDCKRALQNISHRANFCEELSSFTSLMRPLEDLRHQDWLTTGWRSRTHFVNGPSKGGIHRLYRFYCSRFHRFCCQIYRREHLETSHKIKYGKPGSGESWGACMTIWNGFLGSEYM